MEKHLFTVEYVGVIPTRGVILSPGVDVEDRGQLAVGDSIEIRRHNKIIKTFIAGFYRFSRSPDSSRPTTWDILIDIRFNKSDIALGSEVWLTRDDCR